MARRKARGLSVRLSDCPSIYLSVCASIHRSVPLSLCPSSYLSVFICAFLFICLSLYPSVCPSICLSVWRHISTQPSAAVSLPSPLVSASPPPRLTAKRTPQKEKNRGKGKGKRRNEDGRGRNSVAFVSGDGDCMRRCVHSGVSETGTDRDH